MQIFGTFFIGLLSSLFEFFVKWMTRRLALVTAVIAFLSGLAAAFFAAVFSLISTVQFALSDHYLSMALAIFWPVHLSICISVIFSAHVTRWVYDRSTFYVGLFWESAGR